MKKLVRYQAAVMVIAASGVVGTAYAAGGGIFNPKNFSATATFTSDYVFRGISNTTNGPAIQGSFDWAYKGFNAGIWGSNTDAGAGESMELDGYGGYSWSWMGLDLNISGLYYAYPGNSGLAGKNGANVTPEYAEVHAGVAHTFSNVMWSPAVGVDYYYSPDFYGEDGDGHYVDGTLSLSLPHGFTANGLVGWQDVQGRKSTNGFDYGNWLIGVGKSFYGFDFDLNYQDTWHNQGICAGTDICDGRVVFSVSRSL